MGKDKREARRMWLFGLLAVTAGLVYFLWGQYNTALTLYDLIFLRQNADKQLAQDEGWALSAEDEAVYQAALRRGEDWAAAREAQGEAQRGSVTVRGVGLAERAETGLALDYTLYGQPGGKTVILLHGYQEGPTQALAWAPDWWEAGYSVLIPTQRGYGAEALPVSFGGWEQFDLGDLISALALTEDTLLLHGRGAGAAAALYLAAAENGPLSQGLGLDGVVAEGVYDNLGAVLRAQLKRQFGLGDFLCGRFLRGVAAQKLHLEPDSADLTAAAAEIEIPVLFLCSEGDAFLGAARTKAVAAAKTQGQAQLAVLEDAPYRLLWAARREAYWANVLRFLEITENP